MGKILESIQTKKQRLHQVVKIFRFLKVILEGDSQLIVDILKGDSVVPWRIRDTMDNSKMHKRFFTHYRIQHVYKEENFSMDIAANEGLKCSTWSHLEYG